MYEYDLIANKHLQNSTHTNTNTERGRGEEQEAGGEGGSVTEKRKEISEEEKIH